MIEVCEFKTFDEINRNVSDVERLEAIESESTMNVLYVIRVSIMSTTCVSFESKWIMILMRKRANYCGL